MGWFGPFHKLDRRRLLHRRLGMTALDSLPVSSLRHLTHDSQQSNAMARRLRVAVSGVVQSIPVYIVDHLFGTQNSVDMTFKMPATDKVPLDDLRQLERSDDQQPESLAEASVRVTHHRGRTLVSFTGAIGLSVIESLHATLRGLADGDEDIILDCSKVDHLDSSALQVLVATQTALAARQHTVRIESESLEIRNYLNLVGLAERFPPKTAAVRAPRKRTAKVAKPT